MLESEQFNRIHPDYRSCLVGHIAGLVRDRVKAEDIASQAFAKAWENRESFEGRSSPSTWLETIGRREALESLMFERRRQHETIDHPQVAELAAPGLVTDDIGKRDGS